MLQYLRHFFFGMQTPFLSRTYPSMQTQAGFVGQRPGMILGHAIGFPNCLHVMGTQRIGGHSTHLSFFLHRPEENYVRLSARELT